MENPGQFRVEINRYGLARLMTAINPNGHKAVAVVFRKTPPALSSKKRKAGRHYV